MSMILGLLLEYLVEVVILLVLGSIFLRALYLCLVTRCFPLEEKLKKENADLKNQLDDLKRELEDLKRKN